MKRGLKASMMKFCHICDESELFKIDFKNTWSPLFENKQIIVCKTCGFGRIDPRINTEKITDFYSKTYRAKGSPHYVNFLTVTPSPFIFRARSFAQLLLAFQYLKPKQHYNILDIGAGLGNSYITATEIFGDNFDFFAMEEDKAATSYYKRQFPRINVSKDFSQLECRMDLIILSHSLEHFDFVDMRQLFADIHRALVDDGIVMIEVPHADFRNTLYREIRFKDTPHLSFFSLDSLQKLVRVYGFETCFLDTAGMAIEATFSSVSSDPSSLKSLFKKVIRKIWGHRYFSNFVYQQLLRIRKQRESGGRFLRDPSFQYGGNRAVLRCVIRKRSVPL